VRVENTPTVYHINFTLDGLNMKYRWDGIILAPSVPAGEKFRRFASMHDWLIVTPARLSAGMGRGITSVAPRVVVVNDAKHNMGDQVVTHSLTLVNMCGGVSPEVLHVRKAGS
jgi:hypothetical protein